MMRASAPKGAAGTTPRASPSSNPAAPPPWNRDGREMRSLPSVRSQSTSSFTAAATAAAAASAAADAAAGGRRGSASSRGSTQTCASSTAASGTASRRGLRRRPSARSGDGGCGSGGASAAAAPPVWTCLRMRPCVGAETPSPQVTADAVARCVVGSAKGAPAHGASCVFGPAAPQAEVNEALCLELVPLLFGGGGGVVVASGGARAGKTAALFGARADTPDPFGVEGSGEEEGAAALPPSHHRTHLGGVVPALLSDVLRRVADLPVYDCALTLSFLSLPAAAAAAAAAPSGELVDLLSTASSSDVASTAAPAVREALPHAGPSLHGHVECAVETPHDFAALWAQARRRLQDVAADTPPPVVICCVSLTRVDSRNGATSQGQLLFVDLPASGHASSAAAVSKVLTAVDAGEGCGGGGGGGDGFVPWRDSRLTRLMQCAFTPAPPSPLAHAPRFFLLGTLAPTAELAADALATAGFVGQFHRAGGGGGGGASAGGAELEHATDVARRLQRRLDCLSLAHPAALRAAVDAAHLLRRDKAHLEKQLAAARAETAAAVEAAAAAAAHHPPPVVAAAAPVSTKPPPIANVLHILARYKVVRPEIGHGTAAVVGQLVSQLAARERVVCAAAPRQSDVRCLPSGTWGALLRELAAAEPSCVPTADPRSSHQPAHLCQDRAGFQEWWSAAQTPQQQQNPQKALAVGPPQQQQTAASARRPAAAAATASSVAAALPRTQQPITPAAAEASAPPPAPEVFEDAGLAGPVVSPLVIPNAVEVSPQPQPQPQPRSEEARSASASRSRTPPSGHGGVSAHLQEAISSVVQALDGHTAASAAQAAAATAATAATAEAEATTLPMTNTLPMSAAGGPAAATAGEASEGMRRPAHSSTSSSPPKRAAAPQAAEAAAAAASQSPAPVSPKDTPRAAGGRRYDDEGEYVF